MDGALIRDTRALPRDDVLSVYRSHQWEAAEKPDQLIAGLAASHSLLSAWAGPRLVGLVNALSDGHLVVYYPHLLVHADHAGRGIGTALMRAIMVRYAGFHQHVLIAERPAVGFYERLGFERAGDTQAMWIMTAKA